jgi:FkbM family methyltransferase
MYSQYGEENIILSFFNHKKNGLCVDVGAADGILYSNSRFLIEKQEWNAFLIEPHPTFFKKLEKLYNENSKIKIINNAVFNKCDKLPFYIFGHDKEAQVSTLSPEFKQKVIDLYKYNYEKIEIDTIRLSDLFKSIEAKIDFLTIDAEGVDLQVLESNDWLKYRPSLICIEHSMNQQVLKEYMESINYKKHAQTIGNTFFTNNS